MSQICLTEFRSESLKIPDIADEITKNRKRGNYGDVLPLKAARRDSIWGFKSELQTNPMPFHLELLWGTTLMPDTGCAMGWDKTKL